MTCPFCGSANVGPVEWGTDIASRVLRTHYPDAHECSVCEHAWSPAREKEKRKFREAGFRITRIKPSTQPPTD